jgi:hypothetical protein
MAALSGASSAKQYIYILDGTTPQVRGIKINIQCYVPSNTTNQVNYLYSDTTFDAGEVQSVEAIIQQIVNTSGQSLVDMAGSHDAVYGVFSDSTFLVTPTDDTINITAGSNNSTLAVQTGSSAPTHTAVEGQLYWDASSNILYINNDGSTGWTLLGGGGEANTASNVGIAGDVIGWFKQKTGVDLEFKGIDPASARITVVSMANVIQIDVDVTAMNHGSLSDISVDQHHAVNHATRHKDGGADELDVEELATAGAVETTPMSDGAGGISMALMWASKTFVFTFHEATLLSGIDFNAQTPIQVPAANEHGLMVPKALRVTMGSPGAGASDGSWTNIQLQKSSTLAGARTALTTATIAAGSQTGSGATFSDGSLADNLYLWVRATAAVGTKPGLIKAQLDVMERVFPSTV